LLTAAHRAKGPGRQPRRTALMFVKRSLRSPMPSISIPSPVGQLTIDESNDAIVAIRWADAPAGNGSPLLDEAARQFAAYFDGKLNRFDLPLATSGTQFDRRVRTAMQAIPYGETRTYGDLAHATDSGPRATGG